MIRIDPAAVSAIVREVVDSEILPRFQRLEQSQIHTKSAPGDLVTEADLEAEAALSRRLTSLLPGSRVVGEEGVYRDAAVLEALRDRAPVWVIDPVDGTGNFVRGNPRFACIVALVQDGITRMGWIDSCVERETVLAVAGQGVYGPSGDRIHLHTSTPAPAPRLPGLCGQVGGQAIRRALKPCVRKVDWVGSAAQTYLDLLGGRIDFAAFSRLNVWDHAAGVLMVREAGGIAALGDRRPYSPLMRSEPSPLVLAPDPGMWDELAGRIEAAGADAPAAGMHPQ